MCPFIQQSPRSKCNVLEDVEHQGPMKGLPRRAAEFLEQLRGKYSSELKDAYFGLEKRRQSR